MPSPRAFWPLTVTAGVNDKIDVKRTSDSALFAAAIAAGTYYTPASLALAVREALHAVWVNAWGVEAIGSDMASFNPSFETDTDGWGQYNNSSGTEPFTDWGRALAQSVDPMPHGTAFFRCAWAVANTTTKGLYTNRSLGTTKAGIGWRLVEWFRLRFKARASGTNVGQVMSLEFNQVPTTTQVVSNPSLSGVWQQYEWRLQWMSSLPGGGLGVTGEMHITIANASGTIGTLDIDDIQVYSEALASQPKGRFVIGGNVSFQLLFASGTNAAVSARDILGWGTTDTASAFTAVSTYQHQNGWYAERAGTDSKPWFRTDAPQTIAKAGNVKTLSVSEQELRDVEFQMLRNYKTKIDAESAARALDGQAHVNEAIERLWRDGRGRFRWWPDGSVAGTYADYALDADASLKEFAPPRQSVAKELYQVRLRFRKWI